MGARIADAPARKSEIRRALVARMSVSVGRKLSSVLLCSPTLDRRKLEFPGCLTMTGW
ncbi:hypothetical protein G5B39_01850 [Rhodobacteraceae bacterium SC52]|nr:hypothetical protein G5B39_01850 [Rhodobacteraceae bacterium SC52]